MRVQIKIGKDIILDSGKKKVAKVIEEPKEKVIVNTVKSRLNSTVSKVISDDKPSDSIFNKKEEPLIEISLVKSKCVEKNKTFREKIKIDEKFPINKFNNKKRNVDSFER